MNTQIGNSIETAKHFLEQGDLVAIPTETVYGLAANALNPDAVLQIFSAKNRPQFNPLILHIGQWSEATRYAEEIPKLAQLLAIQLCPGPITFLLPKKDIVPDLVTAGSAFVAIRVPNHPIALSLLAALDFPLAAPSANESGYISPTSAAHVWDSMHGRIPYILDGGNTAIGLESTIVGFDDNGEVLLHRAGGISIEQIEALTGKAVRYPESIQPNKPLSAGQLKSHYAPKTALYIGDILELSKQYAGSKIATINFCTQYPLGPNTRQFILSEKKDLNEAAQKLFEVMRQIDKLDVDIILTEVFPNEGLGRAMNDRLHRAQAIFK